MRLRYRVGWYLLILLGGSLAFTQARPFPGPDVQQIYQMSTLWLPLRAALR